jgi:hypothetical protein
MLYSHCFLYFVVVPSPMAGCVVGSCQLAPFCVVLICARILWRWGPSNNRRDPCVCTKWAVLVFPCGEARLMTSKPQDWWYLQVQFVFDC